MCLNLNRIDELLLSHPQHSLMGLVNMGANRLCQLLQIRRAMNKSFQESGGTVLSTNWSEVGTKKVEGTPPKGLVMHKWSDLGK